MPERLDPDRLADILEEADLIAAALESRSFEDFAADPVLVRAVQHMLQTIGEAAGHLGANTLAQMPDVPWAQLRGMRNRIVHGYFGIDLGAVWRTAREDVPELARVIRASGMSD